MIRLASGASAELVRLSGERAWLWAERAAAPGTPLRGQLADGRELRIKVSRCVRREDHFEIEGRLMDVERELRLALASELASATSPVSRGSSGS